MTDFLGHFLSDQFMKDYFPISAGQERGNELSALLERIGDEMALLDGNEPLFAVLSDTLDVLLALREAKRRNPLPAGPSSPAHAQLALPPEYLPTGTGKILP